jgi:hypothetical protein
LKSRDNPKLFVTHVLKATPEDWQAEVLDAIAGGARRIAIRAAHGVGKSTLEAWICIWFLLTRRPCKIPVTATTQDQLRDVMWAELAKWHQCLPDLLKDQVEMGADRVWLKAAPSDGFIVARTARPERPEALQGFHSDNLLFVLDEASGIEDIIFETAGGALTGSNAMVLMCANPTRSQGYFHRAFHKNRASWTCFHVPGSVCQRDREGHAAYAAEVATEFGENSNVYRVRVLGEFPLSEDDAVISLALVEAAIGREVQPTDVNVVWGLDVARFGDDTTALAKRRGNILLEPVKEWKKLDLMQVTGKVMQEWRETPDKDKPATINVDVIGLGAGVVDRLRELHMPVRGINVGEAPATDDKRYMRFRDELWFRGREWFEARSVRMPRDDALVSELVGPKYKIESTGKIKVESKDDLKKRGVRSPNKADAFLLTLAGGDNAIHMRALPVSTGYYDPFAVGQPEFARDIARHESRHHNAISGDYDPFR